MADGCSFIVRAARYADPEPPEYCDEDAVEDEEYCEYHLLEVY